MSMASKAKRQYDIWWRAYFGPGVKLDRDIAVDRLRHLAELHARISDREAVAQGQPWKKDAALMILERLEGM